VFSRGLTHKDDAGLQLVGQREGGLHKLLGVPEPLALQHAWPHVDEIGARLPRQRLQFRVDGLGLGN
jgi:hypothetical protein